MLTVFALLAVAYPEAAVHIRDLIVCRHSLYILVSHSSAFCNLDNSRLRTLAFLPNNILSVHNLSSGKLYAAEDHPILNPWHVFQNCKSILDASVPN